MTSMSRAFSNRMQSTHQKITVSWAWMPSTQRGALNAPVAGHEVQSLGCVVGSCIADSLQIETECSETEHQFSATHHPPN
jgi:hypothetical protein